MKTTALFIVLWLVWPAMAPAQGICGQDSAGSPLLVQSRVPLPVAPTMPPLESSNFLLVGEGRLASSIVGGRDCPGRLSRTATGLVVGLIVGGTVGFVHGAAGHPGLPHSGMDVPDEWEYTPLFALAGGIIGGVVGARTARCA